jgi:hypothetical protein
VQLQDGTTAINAGAHGSTQVQTGSLTVSTGGSTPGSTGQVNVSGFGQGSTTVTNGGFPTGSSYAATLAEANGQVKAAEQLAGGAAGWGAASTAPTDPLSNVLAIENNKQTNPLGGAEHSAKKDN